MDRRQGWPDLLAINAAWFGISTATGTITPLLLPYLVAVLVPAEWKNSYLGLIRTVSLAAAMMIQPMAGLLSDRSRSRWGRRRPYILGGALAAFPFLVLIGLSAALGSVDGGRGSGTLSGGVLAAYLLLMAGVVLWQGASNVVQGALQGLIPDLVPQDQRGTASGVKSVMELTAAVPLIWIGPLVDAGLLWPVLGIVALVTVVPSLVTVVGTRELLPGGKPSGRVGPQLLQLIGLAVTFLAITLGAGWVARILAARVAECGQSTGLRAVAIGLVALVVIGGAIGAGVRAGIRAGLGRVVRQQRSFTWWVTNRLLYMAAVGSLQVFLQYYLRDVHGVPNPAAMTSRLVAVIAAALIPAALGGGALADKYGRRPLLAVAGLVACGGTVLLVVAPGLPMVFASAVVLGLATGLFMATSWALGADLVPRVEAGRYLGVANLAGAGAGMVGQGIGGPLVDLANGLQPGLGYLVLYPVYAVLFLLSAAAMLGVGSAAATEPEW